MAFFGLDIGSYAIKFAKIERGTSPKVARLGAIYNPVGQILPSDPNQFVQLSAAIKNGVRDHGLAGMSCHLAVPGLQSYISIVAMPALSDAELSSAIKWEAEQHIPVSLDEVNFEYDVVWRPPKGSTEENMSVFMVGVPKTTVERLLELLRQAGLEAIGLEPEPVSLNRAFFGKKIKEPPVTTLVCDFGALSTSFVVIEDSRMVVTHTANMGSLALTRALERAFSLDPSQAEEYKRTYGLENNQLEGKVRNALLPVFSAVIDEVRKTMQFYASKYNGMRKVSRIVMVGGGSNLPGMVTYLAETLSVEVVVGDPFAGMKTDGKIQLPPDKASYGVAVGLALKEF